MPKSYTKVASFPSSSNPAKVYIVSKDEDGALSCDCPAWKFKKGDGARTCKHVQAVVDRENAKLVKQERPPMPPVENKPDGGSLADLMKRL